MHTLPTVGLGLQNLVFSVPPPLSGPVCSPWYQELGEKRARFRCLMLEEWLWVMGCILLTQVCELHC